MAIKIRYWLLAVLAVVLLGAAAILPQSAAALAIPPAPTGIPIVDQTNTLTAEQQDQLGSIIAAERQRSGNQIAILMIPTLDDEALEDYSLNVARTWGVGQKDRNSGVLLLVVKNDRKVRIEVGYGLEGSLTDSRAGRIIRDRIAPSFRQGNYFAGIKSGLEGITTAIHNEVDPQLSTGNPEKKPPIPWEAVFVALFIAPSWLASILGRTKSWWAGGVIGAVIGLVITFIVGFAALGFVSLVVLTFLGLIFDKVVSANYRQRAASGLAPSWWAGGTHLGGGGSGSSGGFGGGSFGGGGSSGSW